MEVLIVIYLIIVVALIGVVLIQRSEGGGLGVGGGSGFMSARGTANALTRTTAILATLFFIMSIGLGILSKYGNNPTDVLDRIPATTGQGNGILNELGGAQTPPAQNPAAPNNAVPNGGQQAPVPAEPAAPTAQPAPQAPAASQPNQNGTEVPTGN